MALKKDRIEVFNRATDCGELDDVSVFEDLVGVHYHHFEFLYGVLSWFDFIDHVDDIDCVVSEDGTEFSIKLSKSITDEVEALLYNIIAESEKRYNEVTSECDVKTKKLLVLSLRDVE